MQSLEICGKNQNSDISETSNRINDIGVSIIFPPIKSKFEASSVLSYSISSGKTVVVTNDGLVHAIGDNSKYGISKSLPKGIIEKFTNIEIRGSDNTPCTTISAVCNDNYILYLITNHIREFNQLAYYHSELSSPSPIILDTGNRNPISIFGGCHGCAAIDSDRSILYISKSFYKSPSKLVEPVQLPDNEKASSVVSIEKYVFALSSTGQVYKSQNDEKLDFSKVTELEGKEIVFISGIHAHCFAVSSAGQVFGFGDSSFGRLGLSHISGKLTEFTEITPLKKYNICAAYAGSFHSLFQTTDGKLLGCGSNSLCELMLKEGETKNVNEPK